MGIKNTILLKIIVAKAGIYGQYGNVSNGGKRHEATIWGCLDSHPFMVILGDALLLGLAHSMVPQFVSQLGS